MTEETASIAMDIIMHAGDARVHCMNALDTLASADFRAAQKEMAQAKEKITQAHRIQTDQIQAEVNGAPSEYSLLFAHAQDTLMTINSEVNMTKHLINTFKAYDERLKKLEEVIGHG